MKANHSHCPQVQVSQKMANPGTRRITYDLAISHSQPHKFRITAGPCLKEFGFPQRQVLDSFRIADDLLGVQLATPTTRALFGHLPKSGTILASQ